MGFLKNFSEPFAFALALWPFVSMLLTVPVLALLYHRDNRIRLSSAIVAYGTVLYLLGLLCFTLYPMPADAAAYCAAHHLTPQLNPLQFIGDIRTDGLTAVLQIAFNIVFFLPLGFIMGRIWRWPLPVTAVLSFATSLFLETMQLTGLMGVFPCAYRLFDVDDLLWNTTGALIGFALAMFSLRLIPARVADTTPTTTPGFMRRLITFIIDMTLIGFAVMPTHLFVMIVRSNLPSGSNGSWQSMEPFDWTGSILFLAALILFEGVVPWLRGGCTLGGSFTHMTVETRPREGWRRAAFYVARMATLIETPTAGALTLGGKKKLELARVLAYPQFAQSPERQAEIAATYRARCTLVEPVAPPACELPNCLDRDDQKFLELARDSSARALLTRDKLVLKLGKRPVIAARFAILTPEKLQIQLA